MAKYCVEVPGTYSLEEQSIAIQGEEALAARFIGARTWVNAQQQLSNLAEFEELHDAPGEPGLATLVVSLPPGSKAYWSGQLIVQGNVHLEVFLTRAISA